MATKAIVFAALAVLARRIGPADYGAVEYALGVATLATLVLDGGLSSVAVRRLGQGMMSAPRLAALVPSGQLCLALIVIPCILAGSWVAGNDDRTMWLTVIMLCSVLLLPLKQDWLFQAFGLMGHIVTAQVVRVSVFALAIVLLVRSADQLMLVGVAELSAVAAATAYLVVMQQRRIAPVALSFSVPELRDLGREGLSVGAGAICWASMQYIPLVVYAGMAGMADVGYFGAAHRLGVSLVTFSWIYHFNLYPMVARRIGDGAESLADLCRASMRTTAWGGSGVALVLTLCAEPLLPLLFGGSFQQAAAPFMVLVWTFPLTLISGHARWLLVAAGRPQDMLRSQLAGVVATAVLVVCLVPLMGAIGAAAAMSLSCFVVWVVSQRYAAAIGHDIRFRPCLLPLGLSAALVATALWLDASPWIECAAGGGLYALLALIFDRQLSRDLRLIVSADFRPIAATERGSDGNIRREK